MSSRRLSRSPSRRIPPADLGRPEVDLYNLTTTSCGSITAASLRVPDWICGTAQNPVHLPSFSRSPIDPGFGDQRALVSVNFGGPGEKLGQDLIPGIRKALGSVGMRNLSGPNPTCRFRGKILMICPDFLGPGASPVLGPNPH